MNKALIVATTVILILAAVIYSFLVRDPSAPALSLFRCVPDNGPQLIAKDFEEFIWISGMTPIGRSSSLPS